MTCRKQLYNKKMKNVLLSLVTSYHNYQKSRVLIMKGDHCNIFNILLTCHARLQHAPLPKQKQATKIKDPN